MKIQKNADTNKQNQRDANKAYKNTITPNCKNEISSREDLSEISKNKNESKNSKNRNNPTEKNYFSILRMIKEK